MGDGTVKGIVPQNNYFGYGLSRSGTGPVVSRTQGAAGLKWRIWTDKDGRATQQKHFNNKKSEVLIQVT